MTPLTGEWIEDWIAGIEPKPEPLPPFKIEAVVKFNRGEAFVLNREPKFIYEFQGKDLIARDGPFVDFLQYEAPRGRFKAFAGRELPLPMKDGSSTLAKGQYWSAHLPGMSSITYNTKEKLLKCYVYFGCMGDPEALKALRDAYTGDVYPYYAYEAVIQAPGLRIKAFNAERRFDRAKQHILRNLRSIKRERDDLLRFVNGSAQ
ncbi:hypothetical protein [Leisingera sp. M523]|uniref:hypothetical protein n=1 Tax=Leisingera sp. M523 TaxID=2867013 RepID=UPI0021A7C55B|nr:hypothetical protein [Leisingera sp. M523]UWQ30219.1 hypothetical protein K3557_06695 [Leisingera sp. M523]